MMLRYALNEDGAAQAIESAVKEALAQGYRTKDIAAYGAKELCTTGEMGDAIAGFIK